MHSIQMPTSPKKSGRHAVPGKSALRAVPHHRQHPSGFSLLNRDDLSSAHRKSVYLNTGCTLRRNLKDHVQLKPRRIRVRERRKDVFSNYADGQNSTALPAVNSRRQSHLHTAPRSPGRSSETRLRCSVSSKV